MKNLIELLNKNQKEAKKHLTLQNIAIKKVKYNGIKRLSFPYQFDGDKFDVYLTFYQTKVLLLSLEYQSSDTITEEQALQLLDKYRRYFAQFATIKSDSTNNPAKEHFVLLENDDISLYISYTNRINHSGGSNSDDTSIIFSIGIASTKLNDIQNSDQLHYLWYLLGGIAWGLVMFASNGTENGYTLVNFALCMGGGLLWAFLVGLAYETIPLNGIGKNQPKEFLPEHSDKFIATDKKLAHNISICGLYFNRGNTFVAKCYIAEQDVTIAYAKGKKILTATTTVEKLYNSLLKGEPLTQSKSKGATFFVMSKEQREMFLPYADAILQHDVEKLTTIFEGVRQQFEEYNPFSLYTYQKDSLLDNEIPLISRYIYHTPNISLTQVWQMVLSIMDEDDSYIEEKIEGEYNPTLYQLAKLIYQNVCQKLAMEEVFS